MQPVSLRLSPTVATDDELRRLSRLNPEYGFERSASGKVVVSPPAGNESSRRTALLCLQVEEWNAAGPRGHTFESSAGFTMPDGSVLSPDVSWIARSRYEELSPDERDGFGRICPDLVIEVQSPSDSKKRLIEKLRAFRRFGARVALLFDARTGVVVLDDDGERTLGRIDAVTIPAGRLCERELVLRFSALYEPLRFTRRRASR
ncbi:MAG TPA: Uma2 family endonuclease [Candidatus Baltobacteraceae bacterium]|nr:Uma2 family endonuclease [Candidatus Baltobacteraceae bacterium]